MKKKKSVMMIGGIAVFLVISSVLVFFSLNRSRHVRDTAVVLEVTEGTDGRYILDLFLPPEQNKTGDLITAGIDKDAKITDNTGNRIKAAEIQPGQLIEVTHSGVIMETYPAGYAKVYQIKVLAVADDHVYQQGIKLLENWYIQIE